METSKNINNDVNMDTDPDVNTTSWMIVDNTILEEFLDKNEERSSDSDISVISDIEENCCICQSQTKYDKALPQIQFELQDNSYIKDFNDLGMQAYQDEKNILGKNYLGTVEVHPITQDNVSDEDMQTKTDLIEDLNSTELPDDNDISNNITQEQENYYLHQIFKRRLLFISGLTIISIILAGFWLNRKNIFTVNDNIHLDYKPNHSQKYIQKCVYSEYLQNNEKTNNMRNLYCIKNNTKRTYKNRNATKLHFSNLDDMHSATNSERMEYEQKNKITFDAKYELLNKPKLAKQDRNDEIITKYHGNNQHIKAKHRAELKMKEIYLNEQDKYLQKKEKYLKKFEKRIKRMESKIREYNERLKKYNQDPCINHEANKLKNEQSKIDSTQYPGDWYAKRYYNRAEIRKNEKLSDWLFDRSNMRNKLRNKALWYFERGLDRENLRAVGYNEYEKRKIHSYCY